MKGKEKGEVRRARAALELRPTDFFTTYHPYMHLSQSLNIGKEERKKKGGKKEEGGVKKRKRSRANLQDLLLGGKVFVEINCFMLFFILSCSGGERKRKEKRRRKER